MSGLLSAWTLRYSGAVSIHAIKAGDMVFNTTKGLNTQVLAVEGSTVLVKDIGGITFDIDDNLEVTRLQNEGKAYALLVTDCQRLTNNPDIKRFFDADAEKMDHVNLKAFCKPTMFNAQRHYMDDLYPNSTGVFIFLYKDFNTLSPESSSGASNYTVSTETRASVYVNKNNDVAPIKPLKPFYAVAAHEIGHALFLPHMSPEGGNDRVHIDLENNKANNDYCIMNYSPTSLSFCGLCNLRLRGWAGYGCDDLENHDKLVPLLSVAAENKHIKRFKMLSLVADIPATPPKTKRKMPSSILYNTPIRGQYTDTKNTTDFDANTPLVMLSGTVDPNDTMPNAPDLKQVAEPIILTADAEMPDGASIVWSVERAADDSKDIQSSMPSPQFMVSGNHGEIATFYTNAVGSFHIRASVNIDGGYIYDNAETEFLCLNLVLVGVTRLKSNHSIKSKYVNCIVSGEDILIQTNGGNGDHSPFKAKTKVRLIGGGADGQRGLDKVHSAWSNNLTREDTGARYVSATNQELIATTHYLHRDSSANDWQQLVIPMSVAHPVVDAGGGGRMASWQATNATLSEAAPKKSDGLSNAGEAKALGREVWIEAGDAPGQGWDIEPPTEKGNGYVMQKIWLENDFIAYLVFWTSDTKNLVGVLEALPWKVNCHYNVQYDPLRQRLRASSTEKSIISEAKTKYQTLVSALQTNIEFCPPTGKLLMRARVDDGSPIGIKW